MVVNKGHPQLDCVNLRVSFVASVAITRSCRRLVGDGDGDGATGDDIAIGS
jgi:hypothetical protein